ncbi:hypothetical protein VFPFJ_01052 [Purpureocillium lilacinum]|uniref:Uncharacterized protein n=1 Tax=Purpureocillium lilacinum TaxID=33203 RepID=A0A179I087_PURLI|nr:hypothetical protein VFPFJ_01052 [Purpureocillium lilacinum]OAQ86982.1 hypothetical protein VFPBJ_01022 [Purpureocillium lilacinum]OAQ94943.1 hypothetical protein VFPFJ_01052 [Purpureocillium lilacinum]
MRLFARRISSSPAPGRRDVSDRHVSRLPVVASDSKVAGLHLSSMTRLQKVQLALRPRRGQRNQTATDGTDWISKPGLASGVVRTTWLLFLDARPWSFHTELSHTCCRHARLTRSGHADKFPLCRQTKGNAR